MVSGYDTGEARLSYPKYVKVFCDSIMMHLVLAIRVLRALWNLTLCSFYPEKVIYVRYTQWSLINLLLAYVYIHWRCVLCNGGISRDLAWTRSSARLPSSSGIYSARRSFSRIRPGSWSLRLLPWESISRPLGHSVGGDGLPDSSSGILPRR